MKYRVEGELKFMKAPNGNEICVEATGCEMFLWAEREKMIAALKAAQSVMGWAEDGAHISLMDEAADKVDAAIEAIDEALAEAEEEIA